MDSNKNITSVLLAASIAILKYIRHFKKVQQSITFVVFSQLKHININGQGMTVA